MRLVSACELVLLKAKNIYTSFVPLKRCRALGALNGVVVLTGDSERVEAKLRAAASLLGCSLKVYDYGDEIVVPGFVDCHAHVCSLGLRASGADLRGIKSLDEFAARMREASRRARGWVHGWGWDQELMGAWPSRRLLDEAVPDKPAIAVRICGHAAVLNSRALSILGLSRDDGLVFEDEVSRALEEVKACEDPVSAARRGLEELVSNGVTMVGAMSTDAWCFRGLTVLWREGSLPVRVRVYLSWELFEALDRKGLSLASAGDPMFRMVGVKVFADGSLGARTAALREPYADAETMGMLLMNWESVKEVALKAKKAGLDVAVHAIGDRAVSEVIKGFERAGVRGRIEHASLVDPVDVELMAKLGVRVAVQPRFLVSDWWAVQRVGPSRAHMLYPFKTMMKRGVVLGFSSDAPVEPVNPFEGVHAAVTRGALAPYTDSEKLTVLEALYLYTRGSALVLREGRAGCLERGCYMDAVVLDSDPLELGVDEVKRIKVMATLVGGELVYERRS